MVRAVIFDLDGVLVDSEPLHYRVTNDMLAEHGVAMRWEEYHSTIGTTISPWDTINERGGLLVTREEFSDRYWAEIERRIAEGELEKLPGVHEALKWTKELGLKLGLASSSQRSYVKAVLRSFGLRGAFEAVVCREDVARGKPNPDPFLEAARLLGVQPTVSLVIEDSPAGITAARAAGMSVFAVRTPYMSEKQLLDADKILNTLGELPEALKEVLCQKAPKAK